MFKFFYLGKGKPNGYKKTNTYSVYKRGRYFGLFMGHTFFGKNGVFKRTFKTRRSFLRFFQKRKRRSWY